MTTEDSTVQAEADELALTTALADYDRALQAEDFEAVANAQARINALQPLRPIEPNPTDSEMDPVENELEKASPLERALLDHKRRSIHLNSGLTVQGRVTAINGLTMTVEDERDNGETFEWLILSDAVVAMSMRSHA